MSRRSFVKWVRGVFVGCALYFVLDLVLTFGIFYATEFHPNRAAPAAGFVPVLENINEYRDMVNRGNKKMANAGLEDIITTITFAKPLSEDEYENYVGKYGVDVRSLAARGLQPDGTRTSGGFREMIEDNGDTFVGMIAVTGYIDSKHLPAITEDPLTYLADTSRDGYFTGLIRPKSNLRNHWARDRSHAATFNYDFAWFLEDLGAGGYNYYEFRQ